MYVSLGDFLSILTWIARNSITTQRRQPTAEVHAGSCLTSQRIISAFTLSSLLYALVATLIILQSRAQKV